MADNFFRTTMEKLEEYAFRLAHSEEDFLQGRQLFLEYAGSLDFDLGFQDFDKELEEIHIQYARPEGGLILVYDLNMNEAVACTGIRKSQDEIAELKRMFVKERHRNKGLGTELMHRAIALAGELGYKKLRLDTLDTMIPANIIYQRTGFKEIEAYRFNPFENVRYFELIL